MYRKPNNPTEHHQETTEGAGGVEAGVTVVTELAQLHPQSLLRLSVDGVNTHTFLPE